MAAQWLSNLLGGGLVKMGQGIANIVDQFKLTPDEKAEFNLKMETLLQKRDSEIEQTIQKELDTASRVIEAELAQGDNYTKRARPTIIYVGLAMYVLNSIIFPKMAIAAVLLTDPAMQKIVIAALQPVEIPVAFAVAWGSVVSIYAGGRTLEKRGARNAAVQAMTGNGKGIMAILNR